ncbi:MAG: hypothetical protein JSV63_03525 [Candidatus Aenigmatarchaeota archaeon]|nr:MAG: hypothetical protein JSV63_03525 [Candidatus Aenigmarchaeota archaeon]
MQTLTESVEEAQQLLGELESTVSGFEFFRMLSEERWSIAFGAIVCIISMYLVTQVLWPFFKLGREIVSLTKKEKELVETRKRAEKQYFTRKIDEKTFNALMINKQEEVLHTRSRLGEKRKERSSLLRTQLSPVSLAKWVSGGPKKALNVARKKKDK